MRREERRESRVRIGPEEAKRFLEKNSKNRSARKSRVADYASQMRDGLWKYSSALQPIVIGSDGHVLDGQHRLMAVVLSGTVQFFDVVYGVDREEVFAVIGENEPRNGADSLHVMGEKDSCSLAAAIAWIARERMGREGAKRGGKYRLPTQRVNNQLTVRLMNENPELRDSIPVSRKQDPAGLIPPSIVIWLHWRFSRIDSDWADQFFEDVGRGVNLREGSPELAARSWLLRNRPVPGRRVEPEMVTAILIKAWNKSRRLEKKCALLKWNPAVEDFPHVEGESD
jgi:hypothetical protein